MKRMSTLVGLVLALALTIPALAQTAPTLSINPTSGSGGTVVSYTGAGYTPNGEVTVVISADGLVVDDTTADSSGAISGSFEAPDRADITGESGNDIPVFAIDQATGNESNRVTFTYTTPQLPGTGIDAHGMLNTVVAAIVVALVGGYLLRRLAAIPR